jgi:hypothetical protein
MVSQRPIIAIGPRSSDFAQIIKETNTGVFFDYSEKEALKESIKSYYKQFLEGNMQVHAVVVEQYSRKKLTERLVQLILNPKI